jgi:GAF domain-containing protein
MTDTAGADRSRTLLCSLAELGRGIFGAAACSILRLDQADATLVFEGTSSGSEQLLGTRFPADTGIAGWAATTEQPVIVTDVQADERFAIEIARAAGYMPTAIMATPLVSEDDVIGVLEVLDHDLHAASGQDAMRLLGLIAAHAANALATLDDIARKRDAGEIQTGDLAAERLASLLSGLQAPRHDAVLTLLEALERVLKAP